MRLDILRALKMPEPRDYSVEAEPAREHIANALQLLDADHRHGFWERRASVAALRKRLLLALELLDGKQS